MSFAPPPARKLRRSPSCKGKGWGPATRGCGKRSCDAMAIRDGAIAQGGIAHRGMATISSTALMRHGRQSLSLMEKVVAAGIARGALALGARPGESALPSSIPTRSFGLGWSRPLRAPRRFCSLPREHNAHFERPPPISCSSTSAYRSAASKPCSVLPKNCARCQLVVLTALADVASVTRALATGAKATSSRASADRSWLLHSRPFTPPCLTSRLNWPHAC